MTVSASPSFIMRPVLSGRTLAKIAPMPTKSHLTDDHTQAQIWQ